MSDFSAGIAIFGCNGIGLQAASYLNGREYDFVLVDNEEADLASARECGYKVAAVDYRNDDDLKALGIGDGIDLIFCALREDSENVFLTISARALDPELKIVAIVDSPESADKLLAAGANKIIDPYDISGRKIHELLERPVISEIMDRTIFGETDLNLAEVEIPEGSRLDGTTLREIVRDMRHNLIVLGMVDKEMSDELRLATAGTHHKVDVGDILVVMGPSREILAFKEDVARSAPEAAGDATERGS